MLEDKERGSYIFCPSQRSSRARPAWGSIQPGACGSSVPSARSVDSALGADNRRLVVVGRGRGGAGCRPAARRTARSQRGG